MHAVRPYPLRVVLLAWFSFSATVASSSESIDGPAIAPVHISSAGATVVPRREAGRFSVAFPLASGKPAAVLSFAPVDINDRLGLALDVENRGPEPVQLYADLNGDHWVRGYVSVAPQQTGTLYVFARRQKLSPELAEKFPHMHGIPGGKMSLWAGIEEPILASEVRIFTVSGRADARVEVSNLRAFGSSLLPDVPQLFPFIDRYGQYMHRDWPRKTHADADLASVKQQEDADLEAHPAPKDRNRFGGWTGGPQLNATGHFRVEKYDGKWWLVDPEGRLFWSNGLDCVGYAQSSTSATGRESFFTELPPEGGNFLTRNLERKYGAEWRDVTYERLLRRIPSWGLNTLGGSADRSPMEKRKAPYTLQIGSGGRGSPIDPDSPAWQERLHKALTTAAEWIKDDPWCIGFFVDNEIHASTNPAWWENYYRQVSAAAKETMPDKLYLGSRLDYHDWPDVGPERHEVVKLAAKYCDVISFNFYKFTLDDFVLPDGVDRPAIIGEFHFGALDRGLLHTGLRSVFDQNHRAECYRNYVMSALRQPALVGAHWFQCYDEATTGRFDGENYQIGFLDICDTPYVETIAAAREVGAELYTVRSLKK